MRKWFPTALVLSSAVFQTSCVNMMDSVFDVELAAFAQLEDTTSSGMVLALAYEEYFREQHKWPDSFEFLLERYRNSSSDIDSKKLYQQLSGFSNVSVLRQTDRMIELKFIRLPFVQKDRTIPGSTGTIIITPE